jgi:hypothetical protein
MSFRSALGLSLLTLVPLSCSNSNPSGPGPAPTPASSPTPSAAPTPTATPAPTPTPAHNMNPATQVAAMVTSFLRSGQLQGGSRASYRPGDVLYLTCTPKDQYGEKTWNHGNIQDWYILSSDLQDGKDFYYTDTRTFNPDVHVSDGSPAGQIVARCKVDTLLSGRAIMNIVPVE